MTEPGPLPSTLFPGLLGYYGPLRLPAWPTPNRPLDQATIHQSGPPVLRQCLSRHAVSAFPGREQATMRRFNSACLTAFPASGAGRPLQQSFGDFPEFTHVTACRFAARPNRTLVRGASTGRLPAPIVPVATQANRKFLRRDFHSQDTDTFHGAPGRLHTKCKPQIHSSRPARGQLRGRSPRSTLRSIGLEDSYIR